ncbi:MAG: HEAT repeat domain-containing protein [Gemmatimonadales bacterium]
MTSKPESLPATAVHVGELIQSLVKALRAFQMYLPNNPIYHKAAHNVRAAFAPVWADADELVLAVAETDFVWEEQPVYQQASKHESLAWTLYKDGMRRLTFRPGVEEEEIVRFLEAVNKARHLKADASDDLLTLLWEQEFARIEYQFVESFGDEAIPEAAPVPDRPNADALQSQVREEAPPRPAGIVDLEDFDATLYFLDEKEIAYVAQELRNEYERDVRIASLDVLFDIFEFDASLAIRDEILSDVEMLFPNLLNAGEFRTVAHLLRQMRGLVEKAEHLSTAHRQRLLGFEARLSEPDIVRQLMQSIDEAATPPGDEDLGEVLRELRASALGPIVGYLPSLQNAHMRELLESAADRLAASHPAEVLRLLRDPGQDALREIVGMCGRLKLQGAVPGLGELVTHADPAMRLAAVQALADIGSVGALAAMERGVDDDDRSVRLAAVRSLGLRGYRNVLRRLEPVVLGKSTREIDLTEKMAYFEAFGAIAGPGAVPTLQTMLLSKTLLGYRASAETRACAATALGRIRSPDSRAVLQKAAEDKDLVVRNAVSRALRGLGPA